ncbi:MAG: LptA/OstA family protein, partial [Pseudomonadota bacterium]
MAAQARSDARDPFSGAELDRDLPVALVADDVTYDTTTGVVTAAGNVEVYYGDRTLTADRIVYDSENERISAEGNIILRDPTGATVFADIADLDAELVDGLVEGARSVIGNDTTARLAAVEARRVEGRYNALAKAVYSPCDVCEDDPTPLWRIRARRVIHDEEERIVHYEGATFDLFGVPVAYLPYFRHPDPTVERASGFLTPDFRNSGNYGFGLRVPYYWVIDESSDLTFQPFFTTDEGIFGDIEYRRAFDTGALTFRGSLGRSDFTGEVQAEGHVDTDGTFSLNSVDPGAEWGWDIKFSSDDA